MISFIAIHFTCMFRLVVSSFSIIVSFLSVVVVIIIFSLPVSKLVVCVVSLSVVCIKCGSAVSSCFLFQLVPVPEPPVETQRRRKRQLVFMDEDTQIPQETLQAQIDNPSIETLSLVRRTHSSLCLRTWQMRPASGYMINKSYMLWTVRDKPTWT